MNLEAVLATHRFGLGAGKRDLDAMRGDPRGWLKSQLGSVEPITRPFAGQKSTAQVLRDLPSMREAANKSPDDMVKLAKMGRDMFIAEMRPWMRNAFETPVPFLERYVWFWSNHFTISVLKQRMTFFAGSYEREAIRPAVLGKFEDLLISTVRHPAMLIYLDNAYSIGPDSPAGRYTGKGLNENHAREILELHTVGVNGGYTQADVIELAKILTGWSVDRESGAGTGFKFFQNRHQAGSKALLGKTYGENGEREGQDALRDLARHPSTARHIATKLARHFIADEPPPQAVAKLERVFRDTGGDLRALAAALVDEPSAWQPTLNKMRTPIEYIVAAIRLLGGIQDTLGDQRFQGLAESLRVMGQIPFTAQSPKGWPDVASAWAGPAAIMERVQWAHVLAERIQKKPDPAVLADTTMGPLLSPPTREALKLAADPTQGLALLLASPEFQRR
ncbi:MAG: DUF1800 domain-containing protein [Alphaproteobacteria bacterium]|nr:DUF1800 domain-containing protein [Alphaproteobacteria bacterium]